VTHKSARVLPGVCPLATCRIVLHAITQIENLSPGQRQTPELKPSKNRRRFGR